MWINTIDILLPNTFILYHYKVHEGKGFTNCSCTRWELHNLTRFPSGPIKSYSCGHRTLPFRSEFQHSSTIKLMMSVLRSHLSTSMAWAALAFAKAESFVFTFFFPTLNWPPLRFFSPPSIWTVWEKKNDIKKNVACTYYLGCSWSNI